MKKRQEKKNKKKYLHVMADEANLVTLTELEYEKALRDYEQYVKKHAYCKTYKQLKDAHKNKKRLVYFFPVGRNYNKQVSDLLATTRHKRNTYTTVQASDVITSST